MHSGVKGPISVVHTRRKQMNNDAAIRKTSATDNYSEELAEALKHGKKSPLHSLYTASKMKKWNQTVEKDFNETWEGKQKTSEHPLAKYLDSDGTEEVLSNPDGKVGRNLWEDDRIKKAFDRGFMQRAEELGVFQKSGGLFAKTVEGKNKFLEYARKHPWLQKKEEAKPVI
jgi:hypothetical protein